MVPELGNSSPVSALAVVHPAAAAPATNPDLARPLRPGDSQGSDTEFPREPWENEVFLPLDERVTQIAKDKEAVKYPLTIQPSHICKGGTRVVCGDKESRTDAGTKSTVASLPAKPTPDEYAARELLEKDKKEAKKNASNAKRLMMRRQGSRAAAASNRRIPT